MCLRAMRGRFTQNWQCVSMRRRIDSPSTILELPHSGRFVTTRYLPTIWPWDLPKMPIWITWHSIMGVYPTPESKRPPRAVETNRNPARTIIRYRPGIAASWRQADSAVPGSVIGNHGNHIICRQGVVANAARFPPGVRVRIAQVLQALESNHPWQYSER